MAINIIPNDSHGITATDPEGYNRWIARNVSADEAPRIVAELEAKGWRQIAVFPERF